MLDIIFKVVKIFTSLISFLTYLKSNKDSTVDSQTTEIKKKRIHANLHHHFPATRFSNFSLHVLELQISNAEIKKYSIREFMWYCEYTNTSWPVKFHNFKPQKTNLIPDDGLVFSINVSELVPCSYTVLGNNIRQGYKGVNTLKLQINIVGQEPIYLPTEKLHGLRLIALYLHFKNSFFFNWYQFRILNT